MVTLTRLYCAPRHEYLNKKLGRLIGRYGAIQWEDIDFLSQFGN